MGKKKELSVEYVSKEELKTYVNNAKVHTASQVEAIKNSIRKFGFNDPIAVWKNNEIIEGHGRLLAAMEMDEIKDVPVIRLDELTDKERKAYIIAHNKLTLNTDFDDDLLSEELEFLNDDFDMTELGFEDDELKKLLGEEEEGDVVVEESSFTYKEQYGVIVMCENEAEQEEIYTRLTEEGFTCKVVAV